MSIKSAIRDEEAVSETLGYIIIFGIVFTCIGILLVSGNQIISNTEDRAMFQSVEQSFSVLSSDLRKTAFDASPARTLMIRVTGSIRYVPDEFEVWVNTPVRANDSPLFNSAPGAIKFSSSTSPQIISLEDGAVIKNFGSFAGDSSVMSQPPRIYISDDTNTLMVTVMNLQGSGSSGIGGNGVANINLSYRGLDLQTYTLLPADGNKAKICIKTKNPTAWRTYFNSEEFNIYDPDVYVAGDWVNVTLGSATNKIDQVTWVRYDINVGMS